ncbi:hypothetical protein PanWU01x14_234230 [Parasponia andersonii]|uniref:Transmembrane protein n=1 Tax=Parasponia andersonii TaxID=3476 RepID=A0A2P5BJC0_PARAD|nr:hypothetical protein PanWU01x14_234230 [Parasponia andersonii]
MASSSDVFATSFFAHVAPQVSYVPLPPLAHFRHWYYFIFSLHSLSILSIKITPSGNLKFFLPFVLTSSRDTFLAQNFVFLNLLITSLLVLILVKLVNLIRVILFGSILINLL